MSILSVDDLKNAVATASELDELFSTNNSKMLNSEEIKEKAAYIEEIFEDYLDALQEKISSLDLPSKTYDIKINPINVFPVTDDEFDSDDDIDDF